MRSYENYEKLREVFVLLEFSNHDALVPFQLSNLDFSTLQLIDSDTGWRLVDLRERLLCDKSKMTRIIDHLEGHGLVRRQVDPDDRRAWQVFLTEKGCNLRQRAEDAFKGNLEAQFAVLTEDQEAEFSATLSTLLSHLRPQ